MAIEVSERYGFDKYMNLVSIAGIIKSEIHFSHEAYNQRFFSTIVGVHMRSGVVDDVPVTFNESMGSMPRLSKELIGARVCVTGSVRTSNAIESDFPKVRVYIYADRLYVLDEPDCVDNSVTLCGAICQTPVYRQTPQGREICELKIAIVRPSTKKSDYVPCIAWGDNARYCANLDIGAHIAAKGRFQSRDYMKRLLDGRDVRRTAYEMSLSSVAIV